LRSILSTLAVGARLIVWLKGCNHGSEPEVARQVATAPAYPGITMYLLPGAGTRIFVSKTDGSLGHYKLTTSLLD